jgi:hypothetical protein
VIHRVSVYASMLAAAVPKREALPELRTPCNSVLLVERMLRIFRGHAVQKPSNTAKTPSWQRMAHAVFEIEPRVRRMLKACWGASV